MFIVTLSLGNRDTRAAVSALYEHNHEEFLLQCFCTLAGASPGASPDEIGE